MKRLFILRNEKGIPINGKPYMNGPLAFESKQKAKERRDEVNVNELGYKLHVSKGPEHRNYRGGQN